MNDEEDEMEFLVALIAGLIIGALAVYFYFEKKLPSQPPEQSVSLPKELVKSAHYAAFGPVGMPRKAQDDAFNKLWKWGGQSESGMPRV